MDEFGLTPAQRSMLRRLLIEPFRARYPGAQFWVFGSRARGDFRKYSDLDILIETTASLASIGADLEESSFPLKVELVRVDDLADSYREQALRERRRLD